ncbi:MAG: helix-turn-helix domain-containing protein [Parafilimonas terrae]|nr:helix-turn-helix domain-containing protein [Parafilimonas terrae]
MRIDVAQLGPAIRARRLALRMPLARLADQARIPRRLLSALERGEIDDLPFRRLQRVLVALGADMYLGSYNHGRPTFDEMMRANDDAERIDRRATGYDLWFYGP